MNGLNTFSAKTAIHNWHLLKVEQQMERWASEGQLVTDYKTDLKSHRSAEHLSDSWNTKSKPTILFNDNQDPITDIQLTVPINGVNQQKKKSGRSLSPFRTLGSPKVMKKMDPNKQPLPSKKSPMVFRKNSDAVTIDINRPRSASAGPVNMEGPCPNDLSATCSNEDIKPSIDTIENQSSGASGVNGGSDIHLGDIVDGPMPVDPARTKSTLEHLQVKIKKTKDAIKEEQVAKEQNVNEYLKLAQSSVGDKQQVQRIKQMFEKKNQKSTQTIAQLQKKLEQYVKKSKDIELYGMPVHRQAKDVLKDVGQGFKGVGANIRDGISGFSGGVVGNIKGAAETIVSKPKEFAHHLLKKKYGSADNIEQLKTLDGEDGEAVYSSQQGGNTLPANYKYFSEDEEASSIISGSDPPSGAHSSPQNQSSAFLGNNLEQILQDLQESREAQRKLQETVDALQADMHEKLDIFSKRLQEQQNTFTKQEEEKYRFDRLEEQMNDLTELHQHEMSNVNQVISSMEEKLEYQLEERTRDMQELLDSCSTRIGKMELQQQQQQLISMEGVDSANARAVITKLINVVLALLAVVLVFVSTIANLLSPFLTSRFRILSTVGIVVFAVILTKNWHIVEHVWNVIIDRYGLAVQ